MRVFEYVRKLLGSVIGGSPVRGSESDEGSLKGRIFGASPKGIDGWSPDDFGKVLFGALLMIHDEPEIFGDLAESAKRQVDQTVLPGTMVELQALAETALPFIQEAIDTLSRITDEEFDQRKKKALYSRTILGDLQFVAETIQKLPQLAATIEVAKSLTVTLSGTEADVDELFGQITNIVREREATSLDSLANDTGVKISQCEEGHVVVVDEDGVWHTDTEITPKIRDTLGERLLSTEEGAK